MSAAPQIRTALMENLKELHLPAMRDCFEAGRATGRERDAELRTVPAGVDGAGVRSRGGAIASPRC